MITKFDGFFDPAIVTKPIHIIGCGAIGSTLAVQLTRCGLTNIYLWDFDTVEVHNLANQQFRRADVGTNKNVALRKIMLEINPQAEVKTRGRYTDEMLSGYIFLAVDSIDTRKDIIQAHKYSMLVEAVFDFRMRLKDAQHYGADWAKQEHRKNLEKTMDFTQEEADAATPTNACGMSLSVIPTVETVVSVGVANFINFLHDPKQLKPLVMVNPFDYD